MSSRCLKCALLLLTILGTTAAIERQKSFLGRGTTSRSQQLSSPEYYWPQARGAPGRYSFSEYGGPADLNSSFAWEWHHPEGRYRTVVLGGSLLDDKKNIYLSSEDGVRKFTPDGKVLWHYKPQRHTSLVSVPCLYEGKVIGNTVDGYVFALDMETGLDIWNKRHDDNMGGDTSYVQAYDGIVVTGLDDPGGGGNHRVKGLDANTGDKLWEYVTEDQLWNFMPLFPGDDSSIFMNVQGGVFKVGLHNGTLLWKSNPPLHSKTSWTDGGVILGPDGTSYTCSNWGNGGGNAGSEGALRAFRLQDGKMLWERKLEYPCNSWPAVTSDGLQVAVVPGAFVKSPSASEPIIRGYLHMDALQTQNYSLSMGNNERKVFNQPNLPAAIQGFDAKTGEPIWSYELPEYGRMAAAGDEEGFIERSVLRIRSQCLPAHFSSVTFSNDDRVYVGRSDGNVYELRNPNGKGKVSTFHTGAGFLHGGTSFAPGMMAIASCDGLFVWNA